MPAVDYPVDCWEADRFDWGRNEQAVSADDYAGLYPFAGRLELCQHLRLEFVAVYPGQTTHQTEQSGDVAVKRLPGYWPQLMGQPTQIAGSAAENLPG